MPSVSSSLPGLRVQRPLLLAIHLPARDFQIRPPCGPGSRHPVVSLTFPDSISRHPKPNSPSFPNLLLPQSSPTQKRATSLAAQAKTPGVTLNAPLSHRPHGSSWGSFFERDPSPTFHSSPCCLVDRRSLLTGIPTSILTPHPPAYSLQCQAIFLTCQSDQTPLSPTFSSGSRFTHSTSQKLPNTSKALHSLAPQVLF